MDRWSLSNLIAPVSYKQFQNLTTTFQQAAERSFGTETKVEITALSAPEVYTTYVDDEIQAILDNKNKNHTLLKTGNLSELTADIWKKSKYVGIKILPVDESKAPAFAFAHVEFKGIRSRQATFYIQSGDDKRQSTVKKEVLAKRPFLSYVGDGYNSNGIQDGSIPLFGLL
jgi:hypothetical protein